jgi:CHAT domain-containing protein/tetratricopeptide (TPR) repeat protein
MLFRVFLLMIGTVLTISSSAFTLEDPLQTAESLVGRKKFKNALTIYSKVLVTEKNSGKRVILHQAIVWLYIQLREFDKAGRSLEELKKLATVVSADSLRTKTTFLEGIYYYSTERPSDALISLQKAYAEYHRQNNFKAASNCLIWKGQVEANAFYRFSESVKTYKQALEEYQWPRREQWAAIQVGLARGYLFSNELTSSTIHGRQAEAYYKTDDKYTSELADCLGLLGVNAIFLGDTASFFKHTFRAIQLIKDRDDNYHLGKYLDNIGAAFKLSGKCNEALKYYRKALREHIRFTHNTYRISNTYLNIGEYYQDCEFNFDSATYYFRRCLSIRKNSHGVKHAETAAAYQHLGGLFRKYHLIDSSLVYFQKALQSEVIDFNSSDIRDNPVSIGEGYGLQLIDILSEKGQSLYEKYKKSGDVTSLQLAFNTLCRADSILTVCRSSMYWQESKLAFSETLSSIYDLAFEYGYSLYRTNRDEKILRICFYLMENMKYTMLLESIRDSQTVLKARDSKLKATIAELSMLSRRLDKDSPELLTLTRQRDSLKILTQQRFDSIAPQTRFRNMISADAFTKCQQFLSTENAALVSYYWTDTTAYRIVIAGNEYSFVRFEKTKQLNDQVRRIKKFISQPPGTSINNFAWFKQQSQQLCRELLPVRLLDAKIEKLVIIPDGPLINLPFDVLLTRAPSADCKGYQCLPYLVQTLPTEYWFSFSTVAQTTSTRANLCEPSVLAIAPQYSGKLAVLKGSYDELDGLKSFQAKILKGGAASKPAFLHKAYQHDILHIAGHAKADTLNGLDSYISFSDQADDRLYGYEFVNLKLRAKLVVLTACETGQGEFKRTEGMYSLGRAFTAAGAESILLSAWTVPDASTADIIKMFYKKLSENDLPAESLRSGKQEFLSRQDELTAHPYFWSSMYFMGHYQTAKCISRYQWAGGIIAALMLGVLIFVAASPGRR